MDEQLSLFVSYLKNERHLSDSTISSYQRDINQFMDFTQEQQVTEKTILDYIETLNTKGRASATVLRCMVSLRSYYSFLYDEGRIKADPAVHIDIPKIERRIPQILTLDEVLRLLEQPDINCAKGMRDKAMLELLYATGIKVSELIGINMNSVNLRRGVLTCTVTENVRTIPLGKASVKAVSSYLKTARPQLVGIKRESALFVNCSGERMTRQGFWKIIKHYKELAGIDKDITPHMLRHSFAAHLLENGADLGSIQEMMGFADIASTSVYKKMVKNKIFDVYQKAHPRA